MPVGAGRPVHDAPRLGRNRQGARVDGARDPPGPVVHASPRAGVLRHHLRRPIRRAARDLAHVAVRASGAGTALACRIRRRRVRDAGNQALGDRHTRRGRGHRFRNLGHVHPDPDRRAGFRPDDARVPDAACGLGVCGPAMGAWQRPVRRGWPCRRGRHDRLRDVDRWPDRGRGHHLRLPARPAGLQDGRPRRQLRRGGVQPADRVQPRACPPRLPAVGRPESGAHVDARRACRALETPPVVL